MTELGAVLALLPLHADWKAQLSGAFNALLQQLLAPSARRPDQQSAMLAGFCSALIAGRQRLPLTSSDAAQVRRLWRNARMQPAENTCCVLPRHPRFCKH